MPPPHPQAELEPSTLISIVSFDSVVCVHNLAGTGGVAASTVIAGSRSLDGVRAAKGVAWSGCMQHLVVPLQDTL